MCKKPSGIYGHSRTRLGYVRDVTHSLYVGRMHDKPETSFQMSSWGLPIELNRYTRLPSQGINERQKELKMNRLRYRIRNHQRVDIPVMKIFLWIVAETK